MLLHTFNGNIFIVGIMEGFDPLLSYYQMCFLSGEWRGTGAEFSADKDLNVIHAVPKDLRNSLRVFSVHHQAMKVLLVNDDVSLFLHDD